MAATLSLFLSLPKIPLQCPSKTNRLPSSSSSFCLSPFLGSKLTIHSVVHIGHQYSSIYRATTATVTFSLPTSSHKDSADKLPNWSARAIRSFVLAETEASCLCFPNTGTEALLLGILLEGTSLGAKMLRANGLTIHKAREEMVNLLGKSNYSHHSDSRPPLTKQAQKALDWAIDEKLKSGKDGEITVNHLLLGIWAQELSAGHMIMAANGFNDQRAKELAEKVDEEINLSHKKDKRNLLNMN